MMGLQILNNNEDDDLNQLQIQPNIIYLYAEDKNIYASMNDMLTQNN